MRTRYDIVKNKNNFNFKCNPQWSFFLIYSNQCGYISSTKLRNNNWITGKLYDVLKLIVRNVRHTVDQYDNIIPIQYKYVLLVTIGKNDRCDVAV